jgi:Cdc6-like AAA superfamily ATPase
MTTAYQENPFPPAATSSEEGAIITDPSRFPTLRTSEIERAESAAAPYFAHRKTDRPSAGRLIYLYGLPGSGKTHAIQYLRRHYSPPPRPHGKELLHLDVYVKCKSPDFLTIFRQLMAQISLPAMKELVRDFTTQVAREKFAMKIEGLQGKDAVQAADLSQLDYDTAQTLFDRYLLERRSVESAQELEIEQTTAGRSELKHVLPYITDVKMGARARAWLIGDTDLLPLDLDRLGVSRPIDSSDMAQAVLFAVIRMLDRVRVSLCLYIDQFEKFLLDIDGKPLIANLGLMHSLVEFTQREGGLLILASTEVAWRKLPAEFKQRFGTAQINFPPLKLQTARSLIQVYLNSIRTPESGSIEPFQEASLETLLLTSGGNIRRFLQHCSTALDYAWQRQLGTLSENDLSDALKRSEVTPPVREKVRDAVVRTAAAFGVAVQPGVFQGQAVDFVIRGHGGSVRGLVQVCEAFFRSALTDVALNVLALARKAQLSPTPAPTIVVVVGYSDPDMVKSLISVVNYVVVFDPDSFEHEFGSALASLPEEPQSQAEKDDQRIIEEQIQREEDKVRSVRQAQRSRIEKANSAAEEVLAADYRQRNRDRWREIRGALLQEKRSIEQEIDRLRTERSEADFRAIQAAAAMAYEGWKRDLQLYVGSILALIVGFFVWLRLASLSFQQAVSLQISTEISVALGIVYFVVRFSPTYFPDHGRRELHAPASSLEELDNLAARFAMRPKAGHHLQHRNPQIRYAGILALDEGFEAVNRLIALLSSEPLRLVRWRAAVKLGDLLSRRFIDVNIHRERDEFDELTKICTRCRAFPDSPYIFERLARNVKIGPDLTRTMSSSLAVVSALSDAYVEVKFRELSPRLAVMWKQGADSDEAMLDAFEGGFKPENWSELYPTVRPMAVQSALDDLSPMNPPGLGTYDRLGCIGDITKMYLFFRQWQYLLDNDFVP